jgi:hypothetical protein
MTYLEKFNRLKAILYANFLAYGKDLASQQAFQDHYRSLRDGDPRRAFMGFAIDLSVAVNDLTDKLVQGETSDKFAYLSLLAIYAGQEFITTSCYQAVGKVKLKREFTKHVAALIDAEDFVAPEESQFAFLCTNANTLLPETVLDAILSGLYPGKATIQQTNWLIALEIYQRYVQIKTKQIYDPKEKMEGVLVGYLENKVAVLHDVAQLQKKLAPFYVSDYIFHQMTQKGLAENGAKPATCLDEMLGLVNRHARATPKQNAIPFRFVSPDPARFEVQFDLQPSEASDKEIARHIHPFVMGINTLYQSLKKDEKKFHITNFVKGISQLDADVRALQAQMALLDPTLGIAHQDNYVQSLKKDIDGKRKQIQDSVLLLRHQAQQLLDQGKPSNTLLKIIGIGLLVLGIAGIAATVALSILLPPVALGIAGAAWLTSTLLASTGSGLVATLAIGLGVFSLFKGAESKPAKVTTAANRLINFCEQKGNDACNAIKYYQPEDAELYQGIGIMLQS